MGVDAKEERCGAEPQGKKGQLDKMALQTQLLGGTLEAPVQSTVSLFTAIITCFDSYSL